MSRTFRTVPPNGGTCHIDAEAQQRFQRGLVPAPIHTGSGVISEEIWGQKAKRLVKRERMKKDRQRRERELENW